mmetsp:Transcript_109990/g.245538  ORF Transcript_109990/g.245538 Transcript_109990/m.245538 type:complete len:201 (+) Transcript_109990:124-726(+)
MAAMATGLDGAVAVPRRQAELQRCRRKRRRPALRLAAAATALALTALAPQPAAATRDDSSKGFGEELNTLVTEVSEKISSGLNYSYEVARQEDMRYRELRDHLREGIGDLMESADRLWAEIPAEHLRTLGDIKEVMDSKGLPSEAQQRKPDTAVSMDESGAPGTVQETRASRGASADIAEVPEIAEAVEVAEDLGDVEAG